MAFSHEISQTWKSGNESLSPAAKTYEASARSDLSEDIADGQTDKLVEVNFKVANVKSFYLLATGGDLTVETNNATTPGNTLVLKKDVPYVWNTDSYDTFKFTVDVTAYYVTNASGAAAKLEQRCVRDATP